MTRVRYRARRAWLIASAVLLCAGAAAGEGALVIAGGAVRATNAAIFEAFIDNVPAADGKIAVISAASGSPVGSAQDFADTLGRYGVAPERVVTIALAVTDDADTEFDERQWADNGDDASEVAKLDGVGGVWFTGGDQRRITEVLLDENGQPTPMLAKIRRLHAAGAVIGGTSAGAAIMSDPMITGGEPIVALLGPVVEGEALTMGAGLGFFRLGLVDQHFDARARLGRVAVALRQFDEARRFAIGVDEDTAFVYTAGASQIAVVGSGSVALVDGRKATWREIDGRVAVDGLTVSVLAPGDQFFLASGSYRPAGYLKKTVGSEYNDFKAVPGGGIALPSVTLARMLGGEMLDNRSTTTLERMTVVAPTTGSSSNVPGVLYRFRQTDDSLGFWGRDEDGRSRYSVIDVTFDIVPLTLGMALHESAGRSSRD